jgi:hypothetical protein
MRHSLRYQEIFTFSNTFTIDRVSLQDDIEHTNRRGHTERNHKQKNNIKYKKTAYQFDSLISKSCFVSSRHTFSYRFHSRTHQGQHSYRATERKSAHSIHREMCTAFARTDCHMTLEYIILLLTHTHTHTHTPTHTHTHTHSHSHTLTDRHETAEHIILLFKIRFFPTHCSNSVWNVVLFNTIL